MICALQIPICAGALCPHPGSFSPTHSPPTYSTKSFRETLHWVQNQKVGGIIFTICSSTTDQNSPILHKRWAKTRLPSPSESLWLHLPDLSPWGSTVGSFIAVFLGCNFSSLFLTFFFKDSISCFYFLNAGITGMGQHDQAFAELGMELEDLHTRDKYSSVELHP